MKRQIQLFILIALALILTACGGKESKEVVINTIEEKMDEVEKYYTEANLDVKLSDSSDAVIDENEGILKVNMNESTLESSGEMFQSGQLVNYYSTEGATYAQMNDEAWEDMTDDEDDFKNTDGSYSNVAQVIIDLKDEEDVEMEETDGTYIFTFKGKSEKVDKALKDPYSLSLSGADIKDVEQDLTITVDSDTYYIDPVKNDMFVEMNGQKLTITIK